MKVFGKKTVIIDCEWELEDQPELQKKLESMDDFELIDYLNNNGSSRFDGVMIYKIFPHI